MGLVTNRQIGWSNEANLLQEILKQVERLTGVIGSIDVTGTLEDLTDVSITFPAPGDVLTWNGSEWVNYPPSPSMPAGSDTEVQFNSAGSFGADALFTYTANTLSIPTLNLSTIPVNDDILTQVLVRDNLTGEVKYRDSTTLGVQTTTRLGINGNVYDLSASRTWQTGYADTGVLTFTGLSPNSPTTINIGAVTGWVVDNETTPGTPTSIYVTYPGAVNVSVPTLGSGPSSYVLLDSAGTIVFQNTLPTSTQRKENIWLGKVAHPAGVITVVLNEPDFIISPLGFARDLFQAIGPYINSNVYPYPNGANLSLNITNGYIHGDGINFAGGVANRKDPDKIQVGPIVTVPFLLRTQTGAGGAAVTIMDVANYDVGGVVTPVGGGINSSSLRYIFYVPEAGFLVQYGQVTYTSLALATAAIAREPFIIFPNLPGNSILIGVLAVIRTATALNDNTQARFFNADKFGQVIQAAGAGGVSNTASNGLTLVGTDIQLGGTLTNNVSIGGAGLYGINYNNLTSFLIGGPGAFPGAQYAANYSANYTLRSLVDKEYVTSAIAAATTAAGLTGYVQFNNAGAFDASADFFWNNTNKRLGIGTTSPSESIHAYNVAVATKLVLQSGSDSAAVQYSITTGGGSWETGTNNGGNGTNNNHWYVYNLIEGQYRFTIQKGTGNVGVGTAAPDTKLHVVNDGRALKLTGSTGGVHTMYESPGSNFYFGIDNSGGGVFGAGPYGRAVYSAGNYPLYFYTNDVHRMTILGNGNVGIGHTSPNASLQFSNAVLNRKIVLYDGGDDNQYYGFGINSSTLRYQVNNTGDAHVFFAGVNNTTSLEIMRVAGSGSVSIGAAAGPGYLTVSRRPGQGNIVAGPAEGAHLILESSGGSVYVNNYTSGHVFLATGGGNVGVGTADPQARFHVHSGGDHVARFNGDSGNTYISFSNSGTRRGYLQVAGTELRLTSDNGAMYLLTNGAGRMYITVDGYIGMGTTSPNNARLYLQGGGLSIGGADGSSTDAALHIKGYQGCCSRLTQIHSLGVNAHALNLMGATDGGGNNQWWSWGVHAGSAIFAFEPQTSFGGGGNGIYFTPSGNVGIGSTGPDAKLYIAGDTHSSGLIRSDAGVQAGYGGVGRASLQNGGSANIGYVEWHHPNGTRMGYMGYGGGNITLNMENGIFNLNGAFGINGNTGSSGQVLTSQGGSAPIWGSPGNFIPVGSATNITDQNPTEVNLAGGYTYGPVSFFLNPGSGTRVLVNWTSYFYCASAGNTITIRLRRNGVDISVKVARIKSGTGNPGATTTIVFSFIDTPGTTGNIDYSVFADSNSNIARTQNTGDWNIVSIY